jgi:hypothetical protein
MRHIIQRKPPTAEHFPAGWNYCQRQQVNGRGIQRINRLVELRFDWLLCVKCAGATDEQLGQIMVNAPVALAVGVGQDAAGNLAANAQMIELIVA